jgi:hypothetical protein
MLTNVVIIADWDADGVIASAQLVYVQERLGVFPVRSRIPVNLIPSGPRGFKDKVHGRCWDHVLVVDIPFTEDVDSGLNSMFRSGCRFKLYYFDHHKSTIESAEYMERTYNGLVVTGNLPTSVIVRNFLEKHGIRITPRLKLFVEAVSVIEGGRGSAQANDKIVGIVVAISKYLNRTKDPDVWCKYVRWLADPIPFDDIELQLGREIPGLIDASLRASKEADEELREVAMSLSMSAKRVGYVRLVDARGRWGSRGASALASAIHKIVGEPVVLLTDRSDGTILIVIRSSRGEAGRLVEMLYSLGLIEDKGGHENIAVARLSKNTTLDQLESVLLRLSPYIR